METTQEEIKKVLDTLIEAMGKSADAYKEEGEKETLWRTAKENFHAYLMRSLPRIGTHITECFLYDNRKITVQYKLFDTNGINASFTLFSRRMDITSDLFAMLFVICN